jgi:hypothetical protein
MSRVTYTPATAGGQMTAREDYALAKYNAMSLPEQAAIDVQLKALHEHYAKRNYKPEPSLKYKLDLLMVLGTYINQNGRNK